MNLKNKNILVLGLGNSGKSCYEFLMNFNCKIFLYDDDENVRNKFKNEQNLVVLNLVNEDIILNLDIVVVSPGVSVYHEIIKLAYLHNKKVISELELGLNFCKGKTICVTGSNGKTTTVNLIEQCFNYAKKPNLMVGNVGYPITKFVSNFKNNYIVEVSSFQLETSNIKPDIACILNLSENHLNRHFSFNEYKETKYKIFENMKKNSLLVLNEDDENLVKLKTKETFILGKRVFIKPKIMWVSLNNVTFGAYVKNNKIYFNNGKTIQEICTLKDVKLFGKHNLYNILTMICVAKRCHIKNKFILNTIKNFKGVKHRLQFVDNIDEVDYINDSKSTTPLSTKVAVNSFKKPIILILGGSDKGLCYDDLALYLQNKVKQVILTGDTSNNMEESFKKTSVKYKVVKDFYEAVNFAKQVATNGDVVLLSPATASFDKFKNFEQRGDAFINEIKKFKI